MSNILQRAGHYGLDALDRFDDWAMNAADKHLTDDGELLMKWINGLMGFGMIPCALSAYLVDDLLAFGLCMFWAAWFLQNIFCDKRVKLASGWRDDAIRRRDRLIDEIVIRSFRLQASTRRRTANLLRACNGNAMAELEAAAALERIAAADEAVAEDLEDERERQAEGQ